MKSITCKYCLSICLSVDVQCVSMITSKRPNLSCPNFVWQLKEGWLVEIKIFWLEKIQHSQFLKIYPFKDKNT